MKTKQNKFKNISTLLLAAILSLLTNAAFAKLPAWSYDAGPNLKSKDKYEQQMHRELVDLTARIANAPEISEQVTGRQRFRPAYGPIPWRMLLKPNSVKILFIGQDGTHIAEAANRPATAGFGGRAQDLAAYFGVNEGAAFINTYAFTINGQYNTANTPYVDKSNGNKIFTTTFTDNKFWLVSQDQASPVTQWRNDLIDWIIRNNRDSLQLIVAFGGAAKDGISSFVISRQGSAQGRLANKMNQIQVEETRTVSAGSNKQFALVLDQAGDDLYQKIENQRARAEGRSAVRFDYTDENQQNAVLKDLKDNLNDYLFEEAHPDKACLVFTKGGPANNGILEAAQLGGYDMEKLSVPDLSSRTLKETISLKGLELSKDYKQAGEKTYTVDRDILVVQLPHPTALSMMTPADASQTVKERLKILAPKVQEGWKIEADEGMVNRFAAGEDYQYARSDIGPEYYDFGTPASRMVSVSSASRMSGAGNSHIIVFGSRDRGVFSTETLATITNAKPAQAFDPKKNLFTTRPRDPSMRDVFDPGPNVLNDDGTVKVNYAKIIKENLNFKEIYRMKDGTAWDKDLRTHQEMAIEKFNIKTHPMIADFGHYRGTFDAPRILLMADPDGYDDMVTSRALTGERGQYLQGMLRDLGVPEKYLVIKTVPFGMDGATQEEWDAVLAKTKDYRKAIFEKLLSEQKPELILTDGPQAAKVVADLLGTSHIPVKNILRNNTDKSSGIKDTVTSIASDNALPVFAGKVATAERVNIPRSHLTFYARIWEGTSGDRVLGSGGELKGIAFAEIAPKWAWEKNFDLSDEEDTQVKALIKKLEKGNLPLPNEKIPDFLLRFPDLKAGLI